jgi:hypothetical protein
VFLLAVTRDLQPPTDDARGLDPVDRPFTRLSEPRTVLLKQLTDVLSVAGIALTLVIRSARSRVVTGWGPSRS